MPVATFVTSAHMACTAPLGNLRCQGAICIVTKAIQALQKHVFVFVLQGEMQSQQAWYNLSCQSPQPTMRLPSARLDPFTGRFQTQLSDQPPLVASLCSDFAFRSGSCLQIKGATACIAYTDACVLLLLVSWWVCIWGKLALQV
jgi:hypothetical protein